MNPALYFLIAALSGLAAPLLVAVYHRFVVYCFKKTGVQLPDSPIVDADIVEIAKALTPLLLQEGLARKLDPVALEQAIVAAIAKAQASIKS